MKRLFALAVFVPTFALAQETDPVSYDYFDLDYVGSNWDVGGADVDSSGVGGTFSIDIRDQFFIFGDYQTWEFDDFGDAGSTSKTLGLGKAFDIAERWSIYGSLGFRMLDLDVGLATSRTRAASWPAVRASPMSSCAGVLGNAFDVGADEGADRRAQRERGRDHDLENRRAFLPDEGFEQAAAAPLIEDQ
jgi:hypothetical protein